MNPTEINSQLTAPFAALEIEWRIGQTGLKKNGQPWGKCFAYLTNRAIQARLDEVAGPAGWRNEYRFEAIRAGDKETALCLCGLSLFIEGQWVTKWDGAEPSDIEAGKGALSDAMKRAAVQWGIGRYLYRLDEGWAEFSPEGAHNVKIEGVWHRWSPPSLPAWALPERKAVEAEHDPVPPKSARAATAPTAQASYPARQVTPLKIGTPIPPAAQAPAGDADAWRSYRVPRFIAKYAGKTLGDMDRADLIYWATHYEPKLFNGKYYPADVELKRLLVIGADAPAQQVAPPNAAAEEYDRRY
jgi:hypothetical protein